MRAFLLLWFGSMYYSYPFNSWEFVSVIGQSPIIFYLVVLHTTSTVSFHLWCILGGSVWI